MHTGFSWGKLRERGHFKDPDIDGRIILRLLFRKLDVRAESLECVNDNSISIKFWDFLE